MAYERPGGTHRRLVAMVRVLADQTDKAMEEADDLNIAYPQGVVNAASALDSWVGFLARTYRA